uniref:Uncharacterized protein n=1 Tax=Panagrolaimus davidi TaxID=227884 RepID=A0A914QGP7_9BILA
MFKSLEVTENNENLQTWNKSIATTPTSNEQSLKSITIIINEKANEEEVRRLLKHKHNSRTSNNSTLSLHITAYENSVGTSNASDIFRYGSNYGLKKKKEKLGLIKRALQIFTGSSAVIQNPFEFPRQQEEDGQTPDPEMMHFKASQKLLNPNEFTPSSVEDAIKNVPSLEEVLEAISSLQKSESYKENSTIEEAIEAVEENLVNVINDVVEKNAEETLDDNPQQNQLNDSYSDIDKYLATIKSCSITNSTEDISQYNPLNEDNNDDEDDDDRNEFKVDKQIDPIDPDDYNDPFKPQFYISRGLIVPVMFDESRNYDYRPIHKNFGSGYYNGYGNSGDSQDEEYETSSCDDEDKQQVLYEKVTLYDGNKQGYVGIYSDDDEQRSESSNEDMKTILQGNNEEFENENYEAEMPVLLNVQETLNKSCYVDENGIVLIRSMNM